MTLAIIGASSGQKALYLKARQLGHRVLGFAWEKGAVCRDLADRFYPISVTEVDQIVSVCRDKHVDGVVSNASDFLAEVSAQISSKLGLPGNSPEIMVRLRDKLFVRSLTNDILGIRPISCNLVKGSDIIRSYPCVVKPITGDAKKGVSFVNSPDDLNAAIAYGQHHNSKLVVEEYVEGDEVSVESISYKGRHLVVQITDKMTTGAPHFVELAHHQPSRLPDHIQRKIRNLVPEILSRLGFNTGASHTEMKIAPNGDIALIEVNPRGGGDEISSTLVGLSTNVDYIKAMIDVALGIYSFGHVRNVASAGICYLCAQTRMWLPVFEVAEKRPWFYRSAIERPISNLNDATGNGTRNAYLIYRANSFPKELELFLKKN